MMRRSLRAPRQLFGPATTPINLPLGHVAAIPAVRSRATRDRRCKGGSQPVPDSSAKGVKGTCRRGGRRVYGRLVQMGITVLPSIRDGLHCISRRRTRHRVAVIQKLTDAKLSRGDSAISAICDKPSH